MPLIILAIAWLCGLIIADNTDPPLIWMVGIFGISVLLAILLRRTPRIQLAMLAICCAALAGIRLDYTHTPTTPHSIRLLNDTGELSVQGVVIEDPQHTELQQRVLIAVDTVIAGDRSRPAEGLVLAKLPPYPERHYGDRLQIQGKLQTPREAERPGQFDYRIYLERKQIFSLLEPRSIRLLSFGHGNAALLRLLATRDTARRVLLRELPEPQASLAIGILLGLQSSIPEDVSADFSATGTSHILVISGWNITIIATALYSIAEGLKLSKRNAFWPILITIWLYTFFVGATPTVIRAAVMGTVVVAGQRLERRSHAWTTLLGACWAMTIWNPQTLWDLGFQLSALATASLFAFGKGTEALLLQTPLKSEWLDWAREALTATLAAQILALPLILYHFGNFSVIAPIANLALLPMVPAAMLFGAIALMGGYLWLPLGQALAPLAYLFLAWLTEGTRLFARLPYAAVQLPPFPLWVLLGYYGIVVGGWLWNQQYSEN